MLYNLSTQIISLAIGFNLPCIEQQAYGLHFFFFGTDVDPGYQSTDIGVADTKQLNYFGGDVVEDVRRVVVDANRERDLTSLPRASGL